MKRRAFTLVELLVVIAIIALLISILAPSLNAAKNLVRQVMCQTNLKNLGSALNLYAEANKGNIFPGYRVTGNNAATNRIPSIPDGLFIAFNSDAGGIDANDGFLMDKRAIGWAHAKQIWTPSDLLCCPLLATSSTAPEFVNIKRYPQPWGTKIYLSLGTKVIRATYSYSPHCRESGFIYKLQLAGLPSDKPTLTDLFCQENLWGHTMSGAQWFMAFPDTHVGFKSNKKAEELIKNLNVRGVWSDYETVIDEIFRYQ